MTLKNRVGNFLILFGLIALVVFAATVVAPPEAVDLWAFVAGAALLLVGIRFRRAKGAPLAPAPPSAAVPPAPVAPAAARPKRRGPLATVLRGPGKAKTAPPPPAAQGGRGRKGKDKGGGALAGGRGKKK
ncbi:MAG: hypothetical protein IT318_01080 [Anaerolineales bacterium]|nr:hypothetical protein [Anaerolineales bacterium]